MRSGFERIVPSVVFTKATIPTQALGAIDSSKLEQALKVESVQAPTGFVVRFKRHQSIAKAELLEFETALPWNLKRGKYSILVNLSNPATKDSGAIAYQILVR